MDFPRMMYRPGTQWPLDNGVFDLLTVEYEEQMHIAQADGWTTSPGAEDDAPPTRSELEQRAAALGIKVDKRWSDKRLSDAIAAGG